MYVRAGVCIYFGLYVKGHVCKSVPFTALKWLLRKDYRYSELNKRSTYSTVDVIRTRFKLGKFTMAGRCLFEMFDCYAVRANEA